MKKPVLTHIYHVSNFTKTRYDKCVPKRIDINSHVITAEIRVENPPATPPLGVTSDAKNVDVNKSYEIISDTSAGIVSAQLFHKFSMKPVSPDGEKNM